MHSVAKMARSKKIASAIFGRTLMEIYGAEAYAAFLPNTRRAFAGEFVRYERELQKPDGSAAWIAENLSAPSIGIAKHQDFVRLNADFMLTRRCGKRKAETLQ